MNVYVHTMARPNGTPDLNTIGGRLKWIRLERRLTQEALGTKVHAHQSTVAHWEANRAVPDRRTQLMLAEVLDVQRTFLFPDEPVVAAS
jgi:transcriptional regulator with XRE-family HTH domain